MNLETITDIKSWCRTWQLNGFNHIRKRQKLLSKQKRACKSSWSRRGNRSPRIWQSLWRPILESSTPHRSETNGIAEGAVRRIEDGTSAVLLQSGLDEKWWTDSMECYCYLRNIQDLLSDGKTPYERRFGAPFKGPIIPFGSTIEYRPISTKDLSRYSTSSVESFTWSIPRICLVCGENLERRHFGRRHWGVGKDGRTRSPRWKAQCKRSDNAPKCEHFLYSRLQMEK